MHEDKDNDEEDGWTKMPISATSKSKDIYKTPNTKPNETKNKNSFTYSFVNLAPTSLDEDLSFDSESTKQQSILLCQETTENNQKDKPKQSTTTPEPKEDTDLDEFSNENWSNESYLEADKAICEGCIDDIIDGNKLYYWINTSVENIIITTQTSINQLTLHSNQPSKE